MSIDKSLKKANSMGRARNVLTRAPNRAMRFQPGSTPTRCSMPPLIVTPSDATRPVPSPCGWTMIACKRRARFHMFADFGLKRFFLAIRNYRGADLAAAFQNAHHGGLVFAASASDFLRALRSVHVPRLATDESLIRFDLAG